MARIVNGRAWLALAYLAALVAVQCGHTHGRSERAAAAGDPACSCRLLHLEAANDPGAPHALDTCPACQFRAEHQTHLVFAPALATAAAEHVGPLEPLAPRSATVSRPTGRSPPSV